MIEIRRNTDDEFCFDVIATTDEWKCIDTILQYAVVVYDDTELDWALDLPDDEKYDAFCLAVDFLTDNKEPLRENINNDLALSCWDENEVALVFLVMVELSHKRIPGISKEEHENIRQQFGRYNPNKILNP